VLRPGTPGTLSGQLKLNSEFSLEVRLTGFAEDKICGGSVTRSELRGNLGRVLAHSTPPSGLSQEPSTVVSLEIAYGGELRRLGVLQLAFTYCSALCPLFRLSTLGKEKSIVKDNGCGADKQMVGTSLIEWSINDVPLANGASKPNPIVLLSLKDWPFVTKSIQSHLNTLAVTLLY
jgi:hypothetical protein